MWLRAIISGVLGFFWNIDCFNEIYYDTCDNFALYQKNCHTFFIWKTNHVIIVRYGDVVNEHQRRYLSIYR